MKNRTAGWQFVIDPTSRRVLAAQEHLVNECLPDKVDVVREAMKMKKVKANAIIHDDACHFEAHVHRHQSLKKHLKNIKHFIVDEFHRGNHKCKKCKLTRSEANRFKDVRTNMSEVLNVWIRRQNFIFGLVAINFGLKRVSCFGTRISGKCQRQVSEELTWQPERGRRRPCRQRNRESEDGEK